MFLNNRYDIYWLIKAIDKQYLLSPWRKQMYSVLSSDCYDKLQGDPTLIRPRFLVFFSVEMKLWSYLVYYIQNITSKH